ncbi:hypothetical protein [Phocoenobacter skyensis]|uniref:Autotransporter domain-containing protein n=1 Tax=Phocoenobacter skyensis TaxID=97481 RepID=A0ABT9JLR9_9PAST|nr:hypothetical protein [Pasteurella skyensis]MDP8079024.1 hypothetical protein [Pasteurella skyensis]MDP8084974.1 hypothetical protein [Pasteurella skyensis]MDP8185276.1 hypothetical protein [Pasteurella skyensis]QLB23445.1 hypothetical protein A6B44_09650 [Pasteurella skyensis]
MSKAQALSSDGTIAGGWSHYDNYNGIKRAIIWSGKNWQNKTDLGTLRSDNTGSSMVLALSSDGTIAGGRAYNDNHDERATIWSGKNWQNKTDLGTLNSDNTGYSEVQALSSDGTIAGGWANGGGAVLWKIKYPEKKVIPAAKIEDIAKRTIPAAKIEDIAKRTIPAAKIEDIAKRTIPAAKIQDIAKPIAKPEVVAKIDVENTKLSMARLGNDAIGVISLQSQILQRLQQSRYLKQGKVGYGVRQDMAKQQGDTTASVGLGLSYGVGYGITAGINLDKSLSRQLPKSYKTDGNTGLGIFANWKGENWFVETTAAWQKDKVKVARPLLANTEAGSNKTTMKGSAVSLTTGYDFGNVSVYSSLRHRQVSRDAYVEKNAEFAASFAKFSYKDTALALGVNTTFPLTEKLNLLASAEVEQQLNNNAPTYAVSMPAVGSFSKTAKIRKTRGRVQAGLSYDFSPKFMVSFTPYYESTAFGYNGWGTSLQLKGVF